MQQTFLLQINKQIYYDVFFKTPTELYLICLDLCPPARRSRPHLSSPSIIIRRLLYKLILYFYFILYIGEREKNTRRRAGKGILVALHVGIRIHRYDIWIGSIASSGPIQSIHTSNEKRGAEQSSL